MLVRPRIKPDEELTTPEIERYKREFEESGLIPPQEPPQKVGTLQKIFGLLSRGETAPAVMAAIKGEDPLGAWLESTFGPEPEKRITYSDVLGELGWNPDPKTQKVENLAKHAAGLVLDVLGDFKTYLTFGLGGAAKVVTKIGGKEATIALSKAGSKFVRKTSAEFSKELTEKLTKQGIKFTDVEIANAAHKHAIRKLGAKIAAGEGDKFIAKDGLKFMGKQILPREVVVAPIKGFEKMINKVPKIREAYEGVRKAFIPFDELYKTPVGGAYADSYKFMTYRMSAAERKKIEEISKMSAETSPFLKKLAKRSQQKPEEILSELFETGQKTGIKQIDDVMEFARKRHDIIFKEEEMRNLLRSGQKLPNYLRHSLTPEARTAIKEGQNVFGGLSKPLRVKLDAAKPRQIMKTIREANEESMKKYGHKLFEEDFFKAWAIREVEHIRAVQTFDYMKQISKDFGQEFEPVIKEVRTVGGKVIKKKTYPARMIDGEKWITTKAPQLEGVYFREPIAKHIDETWGAFTSDESLAAFLKMYDNLLKTWKGTVTGIWPAFHSRNFLGGLWNNFLLKVKLISYELNEKLLRGSKEIVTTDLGEKVSLDAIYKEGIQRGVFNQPGMMDVARDIDQLVNAHKLSRKIKDAPQWAMEAVENRLRGALFVDRVLKGDSFDEAAKAVFRTHFDYTPTGLTKFERNVMKRLMPFYCVSEDTEILTKEGWKKYNEVSVGEKALTYKNKKLEWQPIKDIAVFDYNGELMRISNSHIDFLATPNHRWIVNERGKEKIVRGYKLNSSHKIPLTGDYQADESILSSREAAILGWIVTDGYSRWKGNYFEAVIYQHPSKYVQEIRELLGNDLSSEFEHPDTKTICFRIKASALKNIKKYFRTKSDLMNIVTRLDKGAMEAMRDAMFRAEGSTCKRKSFKFFAQEDNNVRDAFQFLSQMLGEPLNLHKRGGYIKKHKYLKLYNTISYSWYSGKVWCPQTPNGTWLMRRNGVILPTGNTWTRNNIPFQLANLVKQPGKYAALAKTQREFNKLTPSAEEESKYVPNWMSEMFLLRLPFEEQALYLQLDLPFEDLNKLPLTESGVREIEALLSPILKYPIEILANRNIYFGSEIYDKGVPEELQTRPTLELLRNLPEPIKKWLNFKEGVRRNYRTGEYEPYFEMDAIKLHAIRTFLGRFYSSTSQALEEDIPAWGKVSRLIGGVPVRELDIEEEKYRKEKEYERLLREMSTYYKQRGVIPYANEGIKIPSARRTKEEQNQ